MTLYEINSKLAEAIERMFDSVDPETGEIEEGTLEEINNLQEELNDKLDGCGAYIKNLEAEAEAIKSEADKLKKRAETKLKRAERLRDYVKNAMIAAGKDAFESNRVILSFRASEAVNITDESKLPETFLVRKEEIKPDKTAIKKALKAGKTVEGAELVKNQNLQVK